MRQLTYEQRMPDVIAPSLETKTVEITWQDGHHSSYGFEFLRWQCPCAICRGEGGVPGVLATTETLTAEQIEVTNVGPVGNYAMTITWRDGHDTGIYSWDYLRRICSCPTCSSESQT